MTLKRPFWESRLDEDLLISLVGAMAALKLLTHDEDLLQVQYEVLLELAAREMTHRHGRDWVLK